MSAAILAVLIILMLFVILNPVVSPIASIGDWDGDGYTNDRDAFPGDSSEWADSDDDGVGDNGDAFPDDPLETRDSDGDGIGDVADFFDAGNGAVKISLTRFLFEGYAGGYYRYKYLPDAWFEIKVDSDNDGVFEYVASSEIYNCSDYLENFFSVIVDIDDDDSFIRFSVIVYDVWDTNENHVTDYEIMDYLAIDGVKSEIHAVTLPCFDSWSYSGSGDSDTPDCSIDYGIATIGI